MTPPRALASRLRALPAPERAKILRQFTNRQIASLRWCWRDFWARPDVREPGAITGKGQLPPPEFTQGGATTWANIGGRGSGKTEACSRWVNEEAMRLGKGAVFHLVGQSLEDARATMVEGESGLLNTAPPWAGLVFRPSIYGGTLTWRSGARGRLFGADKPRKGRGPQCNRLWIDDPAAFGPRGKDVLDQLLFGFRIRAPDGSGPKCVISSTPIDSDLLRWILSGQKGQLSNRIVYSESITDDNRENLSEDFFQRVLQDFAGTELELQERFGRATFGVHRVFKGIDFQLPPIRVDAPPIRFLAVAVWIDPATSTSTRSCEVGIVVAGLTNNGHVWILEDLSGNLGANEWPDRALSALERWAPRAESVHFGVETNKGGNQPSELLRSAEKIRRLQAGKPGVAIHEIRTVFAQRGKGTRATPLPRLYRAGQVHHLAGFGELERQLHELEDNVRVPLDRADACVYAVLDLAGVLDHVYPVGGDAMSPEVFGPAPQDALHVGRTSAAPQMPGQVGIDLPFTFGGGDWK